MQINLLVWFVLGPYLLFGGYFVYSFKLLGLPVLALVLLTNIPFPFINFSRGFQYSWFWIMLLFYSGVSLLLTDGPLKIYEFSGILLGTFFIHLFCNLPKNEGVKKKLLDLSSLLIVIIEIHSILEILTGTRIGTQSACFSNPNRFAMAISMLFPFVFYALNKKSKLMLTSFVLLSIASVYLAGARFALLAIFAQLFVLGMLKIHKKFGSFVAINSLIIAILTSMPLIYIMLMEGGKSIVDQFRPYTSLGIRATMIVDALSILKENWLFGVGTGNIKTEYGYFSRLINSFGVDDAVVLQLHNFFLQLLVSYGLIAFTMFAFWYLQVLKSFLKKQMDQKVRSAGLMYLLSFPIMTLGPSYVFDYSPFYFSLGMLLFLFEASKKHGITNE